MECKYFNLCGGCSLPLSYKEQLESKIEKISNFCEVFETKDSHFRNRAEFRIWHKDDDIFYAMNGKDDIVLIDECKIVVEDIYNLMPKLLEKIKEKNIENKLFSIEFISMNDMLVTLIYHKKLDDNWVLRAKEIEKELNISIIGRSRKQKIVLSKDYIESKFYKDLVFRYYENSFMQPNSNMNKKMINWVISNLKDTKDLCELYCGSGNFTIPLSFKFNKVLATEVSKIAIKAAKYNKEINNISNIEFIRLSASEFTLALNKTRKFNRLKDIDLDSYDFSHILVDPPRAGLDSITLEIVKKFNYIIYISCNIKTLKRDLEQLNDFEIISCAMFDQFAYTKHLEYGVILKNKRI